MTSFSYEQTIYQPNTYKLGLHPSRQQAILGQLASIVDGAPVESVRIENIEKNGRVSERQIKVDLGSRGKLFISSDFVPDSSKLNYYNVTRRGVDGKEMWGMTNQTANGTWIGTESHNGVLQDIEDNERIAKVEKAAKKDKRNCYRGRRSDAES